MQNIKGPPIDPVGYVGEERRKEKKIEHPQLMTNIQVEIPASRHCGKCVFRDTQQSFCCLYKRSLEYEDDYQDIRLSQCEKAFPNGMVWVTAYEMDLVKAELEVVRGELKESRETVSKLCKEVNILPAMQESRKRTDLFGIADDLDRVKQEARQFGIVMEWNYVPNWSEIIVRFFRDDTMAKVYDDHLIAMKEINANKMKVIGTLRAIIGYVSKQIVWDRAKVIQ